MGKKPFALVLDVFRAHKHPDVLKLAKKLQIELIFVPSCGIGIYQPLDRKIFGVVKSKLRSKPLKIDDNKQQFQKIHERIDQIWDEINGSTIKSAWNIPDLKKYFYADDDKIQDRDYEEK